MKQEKKNGIPHTNIEGFDNKIQLKITLPRNCIVIDGEIYLYIDALYDQYKDVCANCALKKQCDRDVYDDMMPCELFGDGNDKKHFIKLNSELTD